MEKNKLEWSLKPILNFVKIFGIPTHNGRTIHNVFSRIAIIIITVLSLTTNLFFNGYNLKEGLSLFYRLHANARRYGYYTADEKGLRIPSFVFGFFRLLEYVLPIGIPLLFAFEFYFTGRWQTILDCIKKIDLQMQFTPTFYRRCRGRCIVAIVMIIAELVLFSWFHSADLKLKFNPEIMKYWYNRNFIEKRKFKSYEAIDSISLSESQVKYNKSALTIGMWINASTISIISIFCVLVGIASLLAKEIENQMDEEEDSSSNDAHQFDQSLVLERKRKDFDLFSSFIEGINSCFGPILFLTLSHIFFTTIHIWYSSLIATDMLEYYLNKNGNNKLTKFFTIFFVKNYVTPLGLLYFRFIIILFGCHHLKTKSDHLENRMIHRDRSSINSITQLQFETISLQISANKNKLKITASDIFDVDMTLITTLLGLTIAYSIVLYTSIGKKRLHIDLNKLSQSIASTQNVMERSTTSIPFKLLYEKRLQDVFGPKKRV